MICAPTDRPTPAKDSIRDHYDLATPWYRLVWGPHIHHGLWSEEDSRRTVPLDSPLVAQERLTDTLAAHAGIQPGDQVLDVGCGMGGSSIRLARERRCDVTGITLSGVQRRWATTAARLLRVTDRVRFQQADAEEVTFPANGFDVVWSIECTEHLFDKRRFFQRASAWLKPGGRIAICAWLAAAEADRLDLRRQVEAVCDAFLCPSLGTFADYVGWMTEAGLEVQHTFDWTERVSRTWELCDTRVRRLGLPWIARFIDRRQATFLDHFRTLLDAYRSGAMQYGCIVARRPETVA